MWREMTLSDFRAKDTTCTFCKTKGQFTKLCKSCRKNVNIVTTQIVEKTDFNQSDHPDVNNFVAS